MDTFGPALLVGCETCHVVRNDFQLHIVFVAILLIIDESSINILFTIKMKILELIKWSYRSAQL